MTKQLMLATLFVAFNAQAGDCSPGSPIYEDGFFKYCEAARAADAEAAQPDSARRAAGDDLNARGVVEPSDSAASGPDLTKAN